MLSFITVHCKNLYEENKKIKEELEKIKLEVIKKDEIINFQKSLLENYKNPLNQNKLIILKII